MSREYTLGSQQKADDLLNLESQWSKQFISTGDWSAWLAEGDETVELQMLRQNIEKGLPCGDASFIKRLGDEVGRVLEFRP